MLETWEVPAVSAGTSTLLQIQPSPSNDLGVTLTNEDDEALWGEGDRQSVNYMSSGLATTLGFRFDPPHQWNPDRTDISFDVEFADDRESLEMALHNCRVLKAILESRSDLTGAGEMELDYLNEQIAEADARRSEIEEVEREDEEEAVRLSTRCNGWLDPDTGTVKHTLTCPIHHSEHP